MEEKGEASLIHQRMLELIASDTFEVMQQRGPDSASRHARHLIRKREEERVALGSSKPARAVPGSKAEG